MKSGVHTFLDDEHMARNEPIKFEPTEHDARLAVLLAGHSFDFGPNPHPWGTPWGVDYPWMLIVHHEDGKHHFDTSLSDFELQQSDEELKARIVDPIMALRLALTP